MKMILSFPIPGLVLGLIFSASLSALAAETSPTVLQAAVNDLPEVVKKEQAEKFFAVDGLMAKGSPGSKKAAGEFTRSLASYASDFKESKITRMELTAQIEKSFAVLAMDAKLVRLKVPTTPAQCTVQWKPVLFGDWADLNAQGSWVGFGKTRIRVSKSGYKTKELTIDTKQDPTEQPVTLERE